MTEPPPPLPPLQRSLSAYVGTNEPPLAAAPRHHQRRHSPWCCFGMTLPRSEVVFFYQIIVIYGVIIMSMVQLSLDHGEKQLWPCFPVWDTYFHHPPWPPLQEYPRDFNLIPHPPSDALMDIYPNNTVMAYEIKLPYPLHLDRQQWEVGVSEIHFLMTWYNVAPSFDWFALNLKLKKDTFVYESAGSAIPQPQYGVVHYESKKIPIEKGIYSSEDLVKSLFRLIQEHITGALKQQTSDRVQSDGRRFVVDVKYPQDSRRFDMIEDGKVRFQAPEEVAINHPLMGKIGGPLYSTEVIMPSPLSRMLGFVQLPLLGEEDYKTYTETPVPLSALAKWQAGVSTPLVGGYVGHNHLEITPSMGTYLYRAYLETLLSYGTGAKTSHL